MIAWAGGNFDRLLTLCRRNAYWPTWITHQMEECGARPTVAQTQIIKELISTAGPYDLTRRQRWIMWQIADGVLDLKELVAAAQTAVPFAGCTKIDRCVGNDLSRMKTLLVGKEPRQHKLCDAYARGSK
ncbi:hypothetical protein AS156_30885 [Bradyrhizobium macuxiense]|uniref:Uncharacterized protein n=2 Tax=Bradyrhizobium macuxiense TaxID=1755647 RepID=A0A109K2T6_9BRAD|nr:hypothetical protein AS156_30885 [Bradyrhizobium macuxiense]